MMIYLNIQMKIYWNFAYNNSLKISYEKQLKNYAKIRFPSGTEDYLTFLSIKQITIPSSVISIGNNVFSNYDSMEKITIPSSVVSIGEKAFNKCSKLNEIEFEEPS